MGGGLGPAARVSVRDETSDSSGGGSLVAAIVARSGCVKSWGEAGIVGRGLSSVAIEWTEASDVMRLRG